MEIPAADLLRFSHQIPAFQHTNKVHESCRDVGSLIPKHCQILTFWTGEQVEVALKINENVSTQMIPTLDFFKFAFCLCGVVEAGYEFFAVRHLVTVFSSPNYCACAMMSVDADLTCVFQNKNWYKDLLRLFECAGSCLVAGKIFSMHGGLSPYLEKLGVSCTFRSEKMTEFLEDHVPNLIWASSPVIRLWKMDMNSFPIGNWLPHSLLQTIAGTCAFWIPQPSHKRIKIGLRNKKSKPGTTPKKGSGAEDQ
ncbi:hypothetical protein MKW98_008045 [Papaver atlanticum]|uniref:Serine/threonine specific protein phosphatases domain-containing protein n=1 Tax=Papaver atlanticum TaxID=357466 RepID=A0AAD4XAZ2_9MAGN|nr:hypothetical protein MKW98_008045 [Papaver atlanticum]